MTDLQKQSSRVSYPAAKPLVKMQVVSGMVVFRRTTEGIKFLLLYRRGRYWNFPKGHFKPGENSFTAALRETEEETGIKKSDLHVIPQFRAYERFYFHEGNEKIHDTVILYLAEARSADVSVDPREHSGFAWFSYHDALQILGPKYKDTRAALRKAHYFITQAPRKRQHRRHLSHSR